MKTVGIICEYNPLHLGHARQLRYIRDTVDDCAIVCLMSGNFVQRGMPAIIDKGYRAEAALAAGADLVLELPVTYALSSAEGFAAGGVGILSGFCDTLCFGSECGDSDALMTVARALLSDSFPPALRRELDKGLSFPAARQAALGKLGQLLTRPNDILAVEYCKAILASGSAITPLTLRRPGSYHDTRPDPENPSATAVREQLLSGREWETLVPQGDILRSAALHDIHAGEQAILYRLRTMTDEEFAALPYGSEGLWRKLMHASREQATLEEIIAATKSKRYTRTRIDRMILCAYLGITEPLLRAPAPYTRVLGFNDVGRSVLKRARATGDFPNIGQRIDHPYGDLERRCDDLYPLFALSGQARPGIADSRRVIYHGQPHGSRRSEPE